MEFCTLCGIVKTNDGICPVCRGENSARAGCCKVCKKEMEADELENGLCNECKRKRDAEELTYYREAKAEGRLVIKERLFAGKTSFRVNTRVKVISSLDPNLVGKTGRITHPSMELEAPGEEYIAALLEESGQIYNLKANDDLISYRACRCGSERFTAHQLSRHDVIVDSEGNFESDEGIYDSENPYGPFGCVKCGAEYDSLAEMDIMPVANQEEYGNERQAE